MADPVVMKYGTFNFASVGANPIFTINKEILRTAGQHSLGTKITVTLNGSILYIADVDEEKGSLKAVTERIDAVKNAFAKDYEEFYLACGDVIYKGYPIVGSVDFSNHGEDNYVLLADYTIVLNFNRLDAEGKDGYELAGFEQGNTGDDPEATDLTAYNLLSASDELSVEFYNNNDGGKITYFSGGEELLKPTVLSVQRSLSAQGMGMSRKVEGIQAEFSAEESARFWIMAQLADDESEGIKNLFCVQDFKIISRVRTVTSNKLDGSCNASVTYLLSEQEDDTKYIESFDVTVDTSTDSPLTTINVNGTIQGFSEVGFTKSTDVAECDTPNTVKSAFDSATDGWEVVKSKIYNRLKNFFDNDSYVDKHGVGLTTPITKGALHIQPLTDSIGYNIEAGTVTYSRSYNNRVEFYNDNALTETISYNTNNATDIYASLTVLGRANGPLFQNMGTTTAETRDLSIDTIVQPVSTKTSITHAHLSAPSTKYEGLITLYENTLSDKVYFRNSDTEAWEPTLGHYTRSISWTVGTC